MESILTSIKKLLGISEDYTQFDPDIVMHINTVFMDLNMLGVGPSRVFTIEDDTSAWTDFVPNVSDYSAIKSYMYLRVKLLFDSATLSSAHIASIEKQIEKFEWILNVAADTTGSVGSNNSGNTNTGASVDGFSPIVIITDIEGGHRVTITDIKGTKWFDVLDGKDGDPYVLTEEDYGKLQTLIRNDVYTKEEIDARLSAIPKFSIEVVDSIISLYTLPTENISNTTIYLVKGIDDLIEGGNLYKEFIYVNGEWELLGAYGSDFDWVEPEQPPLAGDSNPSVSVEVEEIEGGHRVSITTASGTQSFDVLDGYTPVKGVDYFTDDDKLELVTAVLNALPVAEGGLY